MKLLEFRSFKLDKKRVQVFEQKISNVVTIRNSNISMKSMSLLKDMISDATIISQLDAKIIIINAGGTLCLVDQVVLILNINFLYCS